MTVVNRYCTLTDIKSRHDLDLKDDTDRDTALEQMIEAASRWIDTTCGRRFYAAAETRYFTAEYADLLFLPDLLSVTTLKTDDDNDRVYETTWTTADYDLEPYNAPYDIPPGPYTMLHVTDNGDYVFPTRVRKGVQIVGSWGYSSTTPDAINEACMLLTWRLYKRNDAVFGVSGNTQLGQINLTIPRDEDVTRLLEPFKRVV